MVKLTQPWFTTFSSTSNPREALNVSRRFRRMFRQMPGNLHRAINGFTLDRFVYKPPGFGFTRTERLAHKNVPKRSRHADRARKPLRPACARQKTEFRFR